MCEIISFKLVQAFGQYKIMQQYGEPGVRPRDAHPKYWEAWCRLNEILAGSARKGITNGEWEEFVAWASKKDTIH